MYERTRKSRLKSKTRFLTAVSLFCGSLSTESLADPERDKTNLHLLKLVRPFAESASLIRHILPFDCVDTPARVVERPWKIYRHHWPLAEPLHY